MVNVCTPALAFWQLLGYTPVEDEDIAAPQSFLTAAHVHMAPDITVMEISTFDRRSLVSSL